MKEVVIGGTITAIHARSEPVADRFARDTEPLLEVLARAARRLTRNEADAEDLLQDTLLHAYAGFHNFQEGTNLKAWLFRSLHNRWISNHRAKQRRPAEVSVDQVTDRDLLGSAARMPQRARSAESEVLDALPDNEIKAALATLPAGMQTVMYYTAVEGYTYAATAAVLGVPLGTVMSRVSRGRQRLRVALAHLDHGHDELAMVRRSA